MIVPTNPTRQPTQRDLLLAILNMLDSQAERIKRTETRVCKLAAHMGIDVKTPTRGEPS